MDIKKATYDELKEELEERTMARETKPEMRLGEMKELEKYCQMYIDQVYDGERRLKDPEDTIFLAAVEMFYGADIWNWVNERT